FQPVLVGKGMEVGAGGGAGRRLVCSATLGACVGGDEDEGKRQRKGERGGPGHRSGPANGSAESSKRGGSDRSRPAADRGTATDAAQTKKARRGPGLLRGALRGSTRSRPAPRPRAPWDRRACTGRP